MILSQQPLPYNEAMLITMLASDNEQAFKKIYDQHCNRIYHVAMRYLKSHILAQEVVQDVFLKLWTERHNINPKSPVEAWLYTVAKNNVLNRLKKVAVEWKAVNHLKLVQTGSENSTDNKLKEAECNQLLNDALESLSENQSKVYRLAREENLSYIQIAHHLNISPLTVKTHMSRALRQLKVFFTGY